MTFWILCILKLKSWKFSLGNTMIGFRFPFANTPSLLPSHMFLTYFEPLVSDNWGPGFLKRPKNPENSLRMCKNILTIVVFLTEYYTLLVDIVTFPFLDWWNGFWWMDSIFSLHLHTPFVIKRFVRGLMDQ